MDQGLSGRGGIAAAREWGNNNFMTFYRADARSPEAIRKAGGFKPRSGDSSEDVLTRFKTAFSENAGSHSQEHVRQGNPDYISFGTDIDCGGYTNGRNVYEIRIPNMQEVVISEKVLGTQSFNIGKPVIKPRLLLDNQTVDTSNFVAMLPALTVEATFVTPVPNKYIHRVRPYRGDWIDF
jgi:hypothetical protein